MHVRGCLSDELCVSHLRLLNGLRLWLVVLFQPSESIFREVHCLQNLEDARRRQYVEDIFNDSAIRTSLAASALGKGRRMSAGNRTLPG